MTGPDLIRFVIENGLSEAKERRANALRAFIRYQYSLDQEVKFKQVELQNKLLDLFVDVPIALGRGVFRRQFVMHQGRRVFLEPGEEVVVSQSAYIHHLAHVSPLQIYEAHPRASSTPGGR